MTRIAFLFFLCLCLCSCDNVFSDFNDAEVPINGPEIPIDGPEGVYLMTKSSYYYYDSSEKSYYCSEDTYYVYDSSGKKINISSYSDGVQTTTTDYEYNEKEQLIKISKYDLTELFSSTYAVYVYDNQGRLVMQSSYYQDNSLQHYYTFTYEECKTIRERYNSDNCITSKSYLYYNTDNLLIRSENYNGTTFSYYTQSSYYDNGKKSETLVYDSEDIQLTRTVFEYNEQWQLTQETTYRTEDELFFHSKTYQYDEHGNLVRYDYYDSENDAHPSYNLYEYEYTVIEQ